MDKKTTKEQIEIERKKIRERIIKFETLVNKLESKENNNE